MPDILCVQETKSREDQIPSQVKNAPGYYTYFSSGLKKGYGGIGLFTRKKPLSVKFFLEIDGFDDESRTIVAYYGSSSSSTFTSPTASLQRAAEVQA